MNRRKLLLASQLMFVVSCTGGETTDRQTSPALLGGAATSIDAVESALIALTRELAGSLARPDSSDLGALLSGDFSAIDTRSGGQGSVRLESGDRPVEYTYLEAVSGHLSAHVPDAPSVFRVFRSGADATVFAFAGADALRARWRREGDAWRATQLILLSSAGAEDLIAQSE